MLNSKYISSNSQNHLSKIYIYIINFLIVLNLISFHIAQFPGPYYQDNIIIFSHSKFKAGNFATNKNGELFIEYYSEDDFYKPASRLFYGRQKNGRELFFNQSSNTQ